jgi:hypothetical protein
MLGGQRTEESDLGLGEIAVRESDVMPGRRKTFVQPLGNDD